MLALLHHDASDAVQALLAARSSVDLTVRWCPVADRAGLLRALADVDVLLHVLDPVTDEVLAAAPRLRLVQKLGSGVNTIDLDAARRRGVAVANTPGANAPAVAEHTLLLLLAALRHLPVYDAATRRGLGWAVDPALADHTGEVAGRTIGLVGFGAVARRLEPALTALGARVLHTARTPDGSGWLPLDDLLGIADVISLHLPLTGQTKGVLDARRLELLRRGAVLVNTARGGLIDQPALVDSLRRRHLGAAGLDVFADEPIAPDDPLLTLDNVVLTPHVAWNTPETLRRCLDVAFENCRRLGAGEPLLHRVV